MKASILQLRQHEVLDFACEELYETAASRGVQLAAIPNSADERWFVGTWQDCMNATALREIEAWPWQNEDRVYGDDAFTIVLTSRGTIVTGKSERATLYAVYHFCKSRWNLEWIYPGQPPVEVMKRSDLLKPGYIHEPMMNRRGFVFENIYDEDYMRAMVDWLAKNRVNELFLTFMLYDALKEMFQSELSKRGLDLTLGGHSMKFFLNPSESSSQPSKQLDYEDESWQIQVTSDIVRYCQAVPGLKRVSLWPEDTAVSEEGSASSEPFLNLYIRFTENLQKKLHEAKLHVDAEHIAYNAGLSWDMLERTERISGSSLIHTLYAYWGRDYSQGWDGYERIEEQRAKQALEGWGEITQAHYKKLTVFEYYSDHFMLSCLFPSMPERICEDMKYYRSLGIESITNLVVPYPQAGAHYSWKWAHGYNSYVFARSAWGDELDVIRGDYAHNADASNREETIKRLEQVGSKLARLSYYNVPLFPARVIDVPKGETAHKESILQLLGELEKELGAYEDSFIDAVHRSPYDLYFCHLQKTLNEIRSQWEAV
ncbi:hypothetical protein [Marinicrinis lubricantis]|uniref:Uncharacterized protein n=1 Tax=Marinicrinis lubricantis TaxID=2086470 RepID=A0ABW1IRI2_9BACL